jgi:hypothetical protein
MITPPYGTILWQIVQYLFAIYFFTFPDENSPVVSYEYLHWELARIEMIELLLEEKKKEPDEDI